MSQSVHIAQDSGTYSYEGASNATLALKAGSANASSSMFTSIAIWSVTLLLVAVTARFFTPRSKIPEGAKRLPKLPGIPWIGRFWGIPINGAQAAWHFGAFHKQFGPIYEWETFGVTHIWIESDKIARDLLVHRGKKYGDRHEIPAAVGVRDGAEFLPLMGIGENFWRHKNFIHALNRAAAQQLFFDYPMLENRNTLKRLLDQPERWSEHIVTHCARVAARVAWGNAKHGTKLLTVVPVLLKAVSPGGPLPNLLPFLMHLPAAISPFKKAEAARKQQMQDAFYEAQQDVVERCRAGTAEASWTKLWVDRHKGLEKSTLDQHEAAHAIGSNALVAIATIGSPLHSFVTAICHYPSWLPRLQEELDRVCGARLPTTKDLPHLPILRAVVKETLRWRQPTPLGVPHIVTEDDVYAGYYIPKGAMVHANHYLISREPTLYPEPDAWRPERWLSPAWPTYKEPLSEYPTLRGDAGFGYGPRACPGIELVLTELHTTIGAIAWGFDIRRKEGRAGHDNPVPWYETNPWVITMACPFACDITPRSKERAAAIAGFCEDASAMVKCRGQEGGDRWDVFRGADEPYVWEGLTAPSTAETAARPCPEGV